MKHQVVILSTADFDSQVWTNKQHLAVGLAKKYDIVYIESLGLRQPSLSLSDVKRIWRKILAVFIHDSKKANDRTSDRLGVKVVTPFVIPFHKSSLVRAMNRRLLHRQISRHSRSASESTLWTFSPLTYGLEQNYNKVIYHSVDLLHTLPRVPGELLQKSELGLLENAQYVIASSEGVQNHLESLGARAVILWENVAHVELFTAATGQPRQNRAVFAGNLTPSKVDALCFQSILDRGMDIAIAGPIDIDGAGISPDISALLDHPRVQYFGNLGLEKLANLLATSKVGLIPYEINDYTRGVFPMKVYEYLAAGLDVVSTPLPSLQHQSISGFYPAAADEFGHWVQRLMARHSESVAHSNIETAQEHSWTRRIEQASALVN